jgi:enolase-phosphatase E1
VNLRVPPAAVLLDIEGTTTPIAFVHNVLFPYARARMAAFVAAHAGDALLAEIPEPRLETLLGWMDRDEKITSLKTIQGTIWNAGYAAGDIKSEVYPDVAPALRRWVSGGLRLYVYSSGSVAAQKLLFGHTPEGDLQPLFQGFFDTRVGPKRAAASYGDIARGANVPASEFLFLSDIAEELDAAAAAGFQTCQLVRPQDGTVASQRHETAAEFGQVAAKFNLPRG